MLSSVTKAKRELLRRNKLFLMSVSIKLQLLVHGAHYGHEFARGLLIIDLQNKDVPAVLHIQQERSYDGSLQTIFVFISGDSAFNEGIWIRVATALDRNFLIVMLVWKMKHAQS